jgi:tRNA uridine 5-carboxymethylaminomethyl modification enzyme
VRAAELAKRQDVSLQALSDAAGVGADLPGDAVVGAELEIKYAGYFEKERARAARLEAQGMVRLPSHLDYESLLTLSTEARQKLSRLRPGTLAQASAIPGISPADLQNLMMELRKARASI